MYTGGIGITVAIGGEVLDNSKYSTSSNPLTGLYYRLHILNVVMSDLKKYRCEGNVNGVIQSFYLLLDLLGRCNYRFVIFMVGDFLLFVLKFNFEVGSISSA